MSETTAADTQPVSDSHTWTVVSIAGIVLAWTVLPFLGAVIAAFALRFARRENERYAQMAAIPDVAASPGSSGGGREPTGRAGNVLYRVGPLAPTPRMAGVR